MSVHMVSLDTPPLASVTSLQLRRAIQEAGRDQRSVERVAQRSTEALGELMGDVAVLVRMFLTVPHRALTSDLRQWCDKLAAQHAVERMIGPSTPVLTLLGTYGKKREWCQRTTSRGYAAIPLVSSEFTGRIPMIAAALQQMGAGVDWLDHDRPSLVEGNRMRGLFFVSDASSKRDVQGRLVIPAQDFVSEHGIRTVFGVGGAYLDRACAFFVFFTSVQLSAESAKRFEIVATAFKESTMQLLGDGRVFG